MAVRLNKTVAIARSGVYVYSAEELSSLGLSAPPGMKGKKSFGVYRPATVIADAAQLFVKLPVTLEHPKEPVTPINFRKYAQGYTGDKAYVDFLKDKNEVIIRSSVTLADADSMNAYYKGIVEVSPGYAAVFDWADGVSPNGEKYEIVMRKILEVNHLALTRAGRGGSSACILDSTGVLMKKRQSGIFYAIHKMLGGVKDGTGGSFTEKLASIIKDRLTMDDSALENAVGELQMVVDYLPDSEDKGKLTRYLSDLVHVNQEGDEAAIQYGVLISNLFCTLDAEASVDIPARPLVKEGMSDELVSIAPTVGDALPPKEKGKSGPDDKEDKKEGSNEEKDGPPAKDGEEDSEEPGEEGEDGEEGDEHEAGESEEEERLEEEHKEAPVMVGIDDTIYDKCPNELSEQERDYLHKKTMEMLKDYLLTKVAATALDSVVVPEKAPVDEDHTPRYPGGALSTTVESKGVNILDVFNTLKGGSK